MKPPGSWVLSLFFLILPCTHIGTWYKIRRFHFSFTHVHEWQFHFLKVIVKCGTLAWFNTLSILKTHTEKLKCLLHIWIGHSRENESSFQKLIAYVCACMKLLRGKQGIYIYTWVTHLDPKHRNKNVRRQQIKQFSVEKPGSWKSIDFLHKSVPSLKCDRNVLKLN